MDSPRTTFGGSPSDERGTFGTPCFSYHRRVKRRWNRVLTAFAFLFVGMQLSMIGIILVQLEDFSRETSSNANDENPLESFRKSIRAPRDVGTGYYDLLHNHYNTHHHQTHHQSPTQIPPKQHRRRHQYEPPSKDTDATPERDVIHIVHTRFMQHQGNMTTLGVARLKQFLAFCLPTMIHQTTQNFLWIIKVDPLLQDHPESNPKILEPLLEAVQHHSANNIYVVASNFNFNMEGHGGSWRDGQEGEELLVSKPNPNTTPADNEDQTLFPTGARVYTGDTAKLKRAYDLRETLPVLETRLDADDGLNHKYLERVQTIALDRFLGPEIEDDDPQTEKVSPPKPEWLYWCILTQIEWHSEIYSNSDESNNNNNNNSSATMATKAANGTSGKHSNTPDYWERRNKEKIYYGNPQRGYVVPIANENFCITPGLTVGYGVGTTNTHETVPRYMHTALFPSLHDKYKFCHAQIDETKSHKGPCLERMGGTRNFKESTSTFAIHALRSRALTSAGMDGVGNINVHQASGRGNSTMAKTEAKTANTTGAVVATNGTKEDEEKKKTEETIWKVLEHNFAIDPSEVRRTQKFLADHRAEIALENILGQCSTGHSCKDKAKEQLRKIAESSPIQ